jgi:hypothetical protein
MSERLKAFLNGVSTLRAQQRAEKLDRLDKLKAMTPEEFVRVPREELQDLTDRQYADVVGHVAPEHRLPEPQEVSEKLSWAGLPSIAIPTAARAAVLGVLTGLLLLVASLAVGPALDWWHYRTPPVRSEQASAWPPCRRLNGWVDGCTYVPARDMAWGRTASLLEMPEAELRQLNHHINQTYIPAQTTLVVWRGRGHIYQEH